MRYIILNKSEDVARLELKKHKTNCILLIALTLVVNLLLTIFTTDTTMTAFLVINILIDIASGIFVYTYYLANISTQKKLVTIFRKSRDEVKGTVENISEDICTHLAIECVEVRVSGRILFLPINTIELACGEEIIAYCASNVIVEVEKC